MAYISGYKYSKEEDAISDRELCRLTCGFPVNQDGTTTQAVNYYFAQLNEPPFWYIIEVFEYTSILGVSVMFEVIDSTL